MPGTRFNETSSKTKSSVSLSTDSSGELHVLGHDGDSLGVDGAEVGVFEKADEIGFGSMLQSKNRG